MPLVALRRGVQGLLDQLRSRLASPRRQPIKTLDVMI